MITDKDREHVKPLLKRILLSFEPFSDEPALTLFCEALQESADQARKEADEKLAIAVKALKNIIDGNDLACERGESMASWMDSDFRRQAKDALKEIQG